LKGVFNGRAKGQQILVTGSARLDFYRHGGESLQGRYHLLRLHPLSVAELGLKAERELHDLLTLGGFPEPFFTGSEVEARRWSREYRNLLVREEITSLERVQDLGRLELELRCARHTDRGEVDVVVVRRRAPLPLVERKWRDPDDGRSLRYLEERFRHAKPRQITAAARKDYRTPHGIRVAPAAPFLRT